jgi:S-DNA-T family DNA segregation ATPase FtsK/SpoIIIE
MPARLEAAAARAARGSAASQETVSNETLEFTSRLIERKLADFGVSARVLAAYPGPVITRYEIEPAVGVKGAQIVNLIKDLARALVGGVDPRGRDDPGKSYMGSSCPIRAGRR